MPSLSRQDIAGSAALQAVCLAYQGTDGDDRLLELQELQRDGVRGDGEGEEVGEGLATARRV